MEMFFIFDERGKKNKLLIWMFKLMVRRLLITELKMKEDVSEANTAHPLFNMSSVRAAAAAAAGCRQAGRGLNFDVCGLQYKINSLNCRFNEM